MKTWVVLLISILLAGGLIAGAYFLFRTTDKITLPLKVVEYLDPNCIHCKDFQATAKQIKSEFGKDVEFTQKIIPILGNSSFQASYAAEAARNQNKYNEYLDILFANFEKRNDTDYVAFAAEIGLDVNKFNLDRESKEVQDRIAANLAEAEKLNVTGTPTVFINDRRATFQSYDDLVVQIRAKITQAKEQAAESAPQ